MLIGQPVQCHPSADEQPATAQACQSAAVPVAHRADYHVPSQPAPVHQRCRSSGTRRMTKLKLTAGRWRARRLAGKQFSAGIQSATVPPSVIADGCWPPP